MGNIRIRNNKNPIEVVKITFNGINKEEIFDYPKNIRIPNIGESIWFESKHGKVINIDNKLELGIFTTTIYVQQ